MSKINKTNPSTWKSKKKINKKRNKSSEESMVKKINATWQKNWKENIDNFNLIKNVREAVGLYKKFVSIN